MSYPSHAVWTFSDSLVIFKYLIFNNLARGMSVANRPRKHDKALLTPAKLPQSPGASFWPFGHLAIVGLFLRPHGLSRANDIFRSILAVQF